MAKPYRQIIKSADRLAQISADRQLSASEVRLFTEGAVSDVVGFVGFVIPFAVVIGLMGVLGTVMTKVSKSAD